MKRLWTKAEDEIAAQLFAAEATDAMFWERLGRSKLHAQQRQDRIRTGRITGQMLARAVPRVEVPEHVIADAMRRATAPRSLTAILCGDPPTGFTSLDRKQMGAA